MVNTGSVFNLLPLFALGYNNLPTYGVIRNPPIFCQDYPSQYPKFQKYPSKIFPKNKKAILRLAGDVVFGV